MKNDARPSRCTRRPDRSRRGLPILAALAAIGWLALAGALPALARNSRPTGREARERLARNIYEELIEIDTTHATGSTTLAAEAMAKRLRQAGFRDQDVQVLGPPRKGNLVARLRARGKPKAKPLLLLAHLDVVAAARAEWSVDPFKLTEKDGYFYGRGTLDDKAMAAIYVALACELAREKTPLTRDLILALTAGEEGGGHNGAKWLVAERRELVDAGLVINEGGHGALRAGKPLYLAVQSEEKTAMNFELRARDVGGHSARPTPGNAIYRLAAALVRVEQLVFPVRLDPVTRAYFEQIAKIEQGELGRAAKAIVRNPSDAEAAAILARQPAFNATLRSTCTATMIHGGHAANALPQDARALVNCRALPGHARAEVEAALVAAVADPKVEVEATSRRESAPPARIDADFLAAVTRVSRSLWPGVPVVPTLGTGATDSTYFRLAGIPAYGVSGLFDDIDDYRAHGRDERLGVRQFYEGLEFLRKLVRELSVKRVRR
ncbi:M20/M25/M40 family metallo-hydrolase [Myxococcota bacterium]|nr:M20/M25/M40 family metallo-hydrolase [Myxococcota bacterium]